MVIITERFPSSSKRETGQKGFASAKGSNCYFGFLLASDDQLSAELMAASPQKFSQSL